jgi:hypothetical protein
MLKEGDLTLYKIGTTDPDEHGITGLVKLILPNCLAKALNNYHIIKTNMDPEKGMDYQSPFFTNSHMKQIRASGLQNSSTAQEMFAIMKVGWVDIGTVARVPRGLLYTFEKVWKIK